MGNACSCVSKNKEAKEENDKNETIDKEKKENDVKEEPKKVEEEIKKEEVPIQEAAPAKVKFELHAEAPEDFKVEQVEAVGKDAVPEKDELAECDDFNVPAKHLDDVAIELGDKYTFPNFTALVYNLIEKRPDGSSIKDDEFEKVCALFTWLTTKNLQDLKDASNSEDLPEDSPEKVLLGITTGKTAYAQLFQLLCRYGGLQCKLIRGYAKGVDYKPGMKLGGGKEAQHAWNSVKVNGKWYLFDCHWAARRLMGKSASAANAASTGTSKDRLKYDLDLFYFMTNPLQLRYTHYPFEEDWQLCPKKITLEEFEGLTLIKPTFFKYGLSLHSHTDAVINVQDKLVLKLRIPIDMVEKICLTFTLTLEGLGEIYEGSNLTRYGMQETEKSTGICTLSFRFPKSGAYKLLLYAREFGDQIFGGICEYKIVSKLPQVETVAENGEKQVVKEEKEKVKPYPPTQQPSYGRTEMSAQYNLECDTPGESASIHISDGELEIGFRRKTPTAEASDGEFPRLMARLKSSYHEDSKLTGRILQRNTYQGNEVEKFMVRVFLPDAGEYALEIYANNPDKEGSSFFLVWQFLLNTEKGTELPKGLPDINPGAAIGAQSQFQEFGLTVLPPHSDPFITVPNRPQPQKSRDRERSDLVIQIGMPAGSDKPVKVLGQLVDVSSAEEETECSDYILQQNQLSTENDNTSGVSTVIFNLRFPKGGCFYKLHIYAAPSNNQTETLPMVFTYLINVPLRLGSGDTPYLGSTQGKYPYQLSQWKDKCQLFEPINRKIVTANEEDGLLDENGELKFKIQVPDAYHVAVVLSGETWVQLSKEKDASCVWSGSAKMTDQSDGSKVTVCACYTSTISSYNTLLEYYTSKD